MYGKTPKFLQGRVTPDTRKFGLALVRSLVTPHIQRRVCKHGVQNFVRTKARCYLGKNLGDFVSKPLCDKYFSWYSLPGRKNIDLKTPCPSKIIPFPQNTIGQNPPPPQAWSVFFFHFPHPCRKINNL